MDAKDIMTARGVTVVPGNSVRRAAQLMLDHRVSGLPVVGDDGRVLGMITEGDLLRRSELGSSGWLAADVPAGSAEERARGYLKSHSWSVGDVMTQGAVGVDAATRLGDVAALMAGHHIKRLPVTSDGVLVGIISRSDLLRVTARAALDKVAAGDAAIQRAIQARIGENTGLEDADLQVSVSGGIVHLDGIVASESQRAAARVVAENIRGVHGVVDRLGVVPGRAGEDPPR